MSHKKNSESIEFLVFVSSLCFHLVRGGSVTWNELYEFLNIGFKVIDLAVSVSVP